MVLNTDTSLINNGVFSYTLLKAAPPFKKNDIVVGIAAGGYMEIIDSINLQGNILSLVTTQASLQDIFPDTSFLMTSSIDNSMSPELALVPLLHQTKAVTGKKATGLPSVLGLSYTFDLSGLKINSANGITAQIGSGSVTISGDWDFKYDFEGSSPGFTISCSNAALAAQMAINITANQVETVPTQFAVLGRVAKYNLVFIGGIPFVLYTEVELRATYSGSVSASVQGTINLQTNNTANLSISYANSAWNNQFSNTNSGSLSVNYVNETLGEQMQIGLVPYISFRIDRIVGPYASLGLQELIKGDVAVSTGPSDWDFYAGAWLQTIVGMRANIIGKSFFDYSKEWNTDTLFFQTPYKIQKVSGDNQIGSGGKILPQPIVVQVLDNGGRPQANVPVYFSVAAGGGSVPNSMVQTDNNGIAASTWNIGSQIGIQYLNVSAKNADQSLIGKTPLEFAAAIGSLITVTTNSISSISSNSAVSGGNIAAIGQSIITARGICWDTAALPTIANLHTTDGSGTGTFTSSISGLSSSTTYHVRAYATSSSGTSYGNDVTFSTGAPIDSGLCPFSFTWQPPPPNVYPESFGCNGCSADDTLSCGPTGACSVMGNYTNCSNVVDLLPLGMNFYLIKGSSRTISFSWFYYTCGAVTTHDTLTTTQSFKCQ